MDAGGLSFREATPDDTEWVLDVLVESARATLNPVRSSDISDAELRSSALEDYQRFHFKAEKPEAALIALDPSGERAGFVWVTMQMPVRDEEGRAWLLEVDIVPRFRGRGLSKTLVARAEEWAREHGARELWLNVGSGNRKALGLYESMGFELESMHLFKKID